MLIQIERTFIKLFCTEVIINKMLVSDCIQVLSEAAIPTYFSMSLCHRVNILHVDNYKSYFSVCYHMSDSYFRIMQFQNVQTCFR